MPNPDSCEPARYGGDCQGSPPHQTRAFTWPAFVSKKSFAFLASLRCQCKVRRSLCAEKHRLTVAVLHAEYYYDTGMSLGHHERHANSHEYLQARYMPALPLIHSICMSKCGHLHSPLCMHSVWCPINEHPDATCDVSTQFCRGHEVHQDKMQ